MIKEEDLVSGGVYENEDGELMLIFKGLVDDATLWFDWHQGWVSNEAFVGQEGFREESIFYPVKYIGSVTDIINKLTEEK